LVEHAPDVIERFDRNLRHVYVNPAIERATGKPPEAFIGKTNRELEMPESKTVLWEKALTTVFQTAQEEQIEFSCPSPSGQRYYQTRLVPEFATHGTAGESDTVETVLGISRDISQRKQAEAEVFKALEAERELNQLKSSFVAMTSHEFRTPLTTIQASTEMLERYQQRLSEEKQRNHFHRIRAAVERMTDMLEDVLVLSQAEAGKLEFQPAPIDLGQLCQSLVEDLRENAKNQQEIVLTEREIAPPEVPPQMDEKLLRHILGNLLSNALKYSPAESTVKFEVICDRDRAIFRIRDRGIGIPPQDLAHLFESFRRATNVGNIQGTGLGLAIVKRCVDLHGGEIQVESEVGCGTTFTVTLPLNCP
jgi:PAS domain S-box-containing protein